MHASVCVYPASPKVLVGAPHSKFNEVLMPLVLFVAAENRIKNRLRQVAT